MTSLSLTFPTRPLANGDAIPTESACRTANRIARVRRLLGLVVLLSAVDLALTLHAMTTTGMFEDNPLVRMLIAWTGSGLPIVALKVLTVGLATGIIDRVRTTRQGELGAWIMAGIVVWVTVQWVLYANVAAEMDVMALMMTPGNRAWVTL